MQALTLISHLPRRLDRLACTSLRRLKSPQKPCHRCQTAAAVSQPAASPALQPACSPVSPVLSAVHGTSHSFLACLRERRGRDGSLVALRCDTGKPICERSVPLWDLTCKLSIS